MSFKAQADAACHLNVSNSGLKALLILSKFVVFALETAISFYAGASAASVCMPCGVGSYSSSTGQCIQLAVLYTKKNSSTFFVIEFHDTGE